MWTSTPFAKTKLLCFCCFLLLIFLLYLRHATSENAVSVALEEEEDLVQSELHARRLEHINNLFSSWKLQSKNTDLVPAWSLWSCGDLKDLKYGSARFSGQTKVVQKALLHGEDVAVIKPNFSTGEASQSGKYFVVLKLLRSAMLLLLLQHPTMLRLKGLCFMQPGGDITSITDWYPYTLSSIIRSCTLRNALSLAASLSDAMDWFENNNVVGQVLFMDWKLDQFLVSADKSHVVVADVDSVYITDIGMKKGHSCTPGGKECHIRTNPSPEFQCGSDNKCPGYTSASNLYHTAKRIFSEMFKARKVQMQLAESKWIRNEVDDIISKSMNMSISARSVASRFRTILAKLQES